VTISWVFMTWCKVQGITTLSRNYATLISRKWWKRNKPCPRKKLFGILRKCAMDFCVLSSKVSFIGKTFSYARDLKPANIMVRNNMIKLGDFGLAKRCRNKRIKIDSSVGSPLYMSLELLKQQPYSSKCDIWAVGCVFYQMMHGKTPWHART